MISQHTWQHKMRHFIKSIGLKGVYNQKGSIVVFNPNQTLPICSFHYTNKKKRIGYRSKPDYSFELDLILNYNKVLKGEIEYDLEN